MGRGGGGGVSGITTLPHPSLTYPKNYNANFVEYLAKEQGTHMVLDLLTWYMYVAPNTGWLYIITTNT